MSARPILQEQRSNAPVVAAAAAGLAVLLLLVALVWAPEAIMRAWLVAWVFAIGFPAGAMVLIMTHALTGGSWLLRGMPVLQPLAALLPIVALLGLPLLFGLGAVYHWAETADAAKHADVARIYLNGASYTFRFLLILVVWSAMAAWSALRGPTLSALAGGAMLLVYGITVSFAAVDWLMSLEATWASSAFPAFIAVLQVASAVCSVALAPRFGVARGASEDLGKLIVACALGLTYLGFIQFLVMWSGNLPEDVVWYVHRAHGIRLVLVLASFLFGAILPFALMLPMSGRNGATSVSLAAASMLLGIALHVVWLAASALGGASVIPLIAAFVALVGLPAACLPTASVRLAVWEARHG